MNLISWGIIGSFLVSLISFLSALTTIRNGLRQVKKEENEREIRHALVASRVDNIQTSLDHAHDKIRDLYEKTNDVNVIIAEIRTTMQESNRVMRQVEGALSIVGKIEERLNGHIQSERDRRND